MSLSICLCLGHAMSRLDTCSESLSNHRNRRFLWIFLTALCTVTPKRMGLGPWDFCVISFGSFPMMRSPNLKIRGSDNKGYSMQWGCVEEVLQSHQINRGLFRNMVHRSEPYSTRRYCVWRWGTSLQQCRMTSWWEGYRDRATEEADCL